MSDKDKIMEKVYFDPAGFGSINAILKDAKVYDKNITYDDVKQWKDNNVERKHNSEVRTVLWLATPVRNIRWTSCFSVI